MFAHIKYENNAYHHHRIRIYIPRRDNKRKSENPDEKEKQKQI